jgi:hypothetical protein
MSIEIFNGPYAAKFWADAHGDALFEAAFGNGAVDWELNRTAWGIVLEVAFRTEADWEAFQQSDVVQHALRTAPEPTTGVLIYRGRSLDSGTTTPRKPTPKAGSGANALALPFDSLPFLDPLAAVTTDDLIDRRALVRNN